MKTLKEKINEFPIEDVEIIFDRLNEVIVELLNRGKNKEARLFKKHHKHSYDRLVDEDYLLQYDLQKYY